MKDEPIVRRSLKEAPRIDRAMLDQQRRLSDEQIAQQRASDPDAPPSDDDFWQSAELVPAPQKKQTISIRLDPEVLAYFKAGGEGYQSRINAVLKSYIRAKVNRPGRQG